MDSEYHDPGRKEGEKPRKQKHDAHKLSHAPESIELLEHSVMSRFRLALDDPESGKDALRAALLFHGIEPETVCAYSSQNDSNLLTLTANAHSFGEKDSIGVERPVRLTEEPLVRGSSIPDIVNTVEDNLSCFPRDAVSFLQHVRSPLPDRVFVLPSTQGSIRPHSVFKDTRFGYAATTRTLYDYRETAMSSCFERAHQVWEDLERIRDEEDLLSVYIQGNRSNIWKINVYKFMQDPLRHFKYLLYSDGISKLKNVTVGDEKDEDGWEEKCDEIYSYDSFRSDFTHEAIENVGSVVRDLLQNCSHVHLCIQLESSEMEDVIVTFYTKNEP